MLTERRFGYHTIMRLAIALATCLGMVISAGKMSGLWSGNPNVVKLQDLDVICAVLGCGVEELLIPEPGTVAAPEPAAEGKAAADGTARPAVVPRGQSGRTLPPR